MVKNKRAKSEVLMDNIIFIILLVLFVSLMAVFVYKQQEGAGVWEEFYAAEIGRAVNLASEGDEITLNVHKGTEIALKNNIAFGDMFGFDNEKNEIYVKLSERGKTVFRFWSDVDAVNEKVELGLGDGVNKLKFEVKEAGNE